MAESGVFRKKVFGGFDTKEVFEYFDKINRDFEEERSDLQKRLDDIIAEREREQRDDKQKDEKIAELTAQLEQAEAQRDEYKAQYGELSEKYAAESDENSGKGEKIAELSNALADLKQEYERVVGENSELSERLKKYDGDETYKSRCDTLSRKVMKSQSEIMLLKSSLDKENERSESLAAAINDIGSINFGLLDEKVGLLAELAELVEAAEQIRSKVEAAKLLCEQR